MTQGTISDLRNERIVVSSFSSPEPIRYFHGEGTIYVDEHGDLISLKIVRSGMSVIVFYTQTGDNRIANRIVVYNSNPPSERDRAPQFGTL